MAYAGPSQANAKQTYRASQKLEPFFTGGAARVSGDGRVLACVCAEETKVVDVATGAVLLTIEGVSCAWWGRRWHAGRWGACRRRRLSGGPPEGPAGGHTTCTGKLVAASHGMHMCRAGQTDASKAVAHKLGHIRTPAPTRQDSEPVTALAVSPDNTTLVTASRSLMLRVYDLHTGQLKRSWKTHKAAVADMAIDASGGWVGM